MQLLTLNKHFFIGCALLMGCGTLPCEDTIKTELKSPTSAYVATVSERNCGATTNFSTMVSLRKNESKINLDEKNRILVVEGTCPINIFWKGKDTLSVSQVAGEVFLSRKEWNGVRIFFE